MWDKENGKTEVSRTKIFLGLGLILISNLIYLGQSYLVKWTGLTASEVAMTRGTFQVVVFSSVLLYQRRKQTEKSNNPGSQKSGKLKLSGLLVSYAFLNASMSFACLAAIPLMPIGDIIVISFSAPVFSVFLQRLILKTPLSVLTVLLCVAVVCGDVLVVKPPFLFGQEEEGGTLTNTTTNKDPLLRASSETDKAAYYFGVGLCLYAALTASLSNIFATKLNEMGMGPNQLGLVAGVFAILLALVSMAFMENRVLAGTGLSLYPALLLPVSGLATMVAFWLITLALDLTRHPTLIMVMRSTEILLSLFTESLYQGRAPDTINILGSLLVLVSVVLMTVSKEVSTLLRNSANKLWGARQNYDDITKIKAGSKDKKKFPI